MPVSQRKLLGAWYTPPQLVDAVVYEVRRGFAPGTVLDQQPAEGSPVRQHQSVQLVVAR